jgi:hypothetical protein
VLADGVAIAKHFLRGVGTEDEHVAVLGEITFLEVTTLRDIQLAQLAIGI